MLEASVSMSPEAIIVTKASSGRLSPLNIHVLQPLDYLVHMFGTLKRVRLLMRNNVSCKIAISCVDMQWLLRTVW